MVKLIPKCVIHHNLCLLTSEYVSVKKIADSTQLAEQNQQLISSYDLPLFPADAVEYAPDIWLVHSHRWAAQPVHGACVAEFHGDWQ